MAGLMMCAFLRFADAKKILLVDSDVALTVPLGKDIDDDLAILYAHETPDLEIVSVTATFGNAAVKECCGAAERLRERLDAEWPVSCGFGYFSDFKSSKMSPAAEILMKKTMAAASEENKIIWVGLGSFKNIAAALFHGGRALVERIDHLILMGGSFDSADLNTIADLEAARFVFEYPRLNRTVLTKQACMYALIQMTHLDQLSRCNGSYVFEHMKKIRFHAKTMGLINDIFFGKGPHSPEESSQGFYPWDVVAMSAVVDEGKFFRDVKCQMVDMKGVRIQTFDVPCDHERASILPSSIDEKPFLEALIPKLCKAGTESSRQTVI